MKGRCIKKLVYEQMFPRPRGQDPVNFDTLLQRYLILEIRQEVISFYGHLDTCEAKYPGLDYNNRTHRIRLSRWQWHRRLFRALDALRLTPSEISNLTKWEGTKWAKERYEREQNCIIRDTAMDGLSVRTGELSTERVRQQRRTQTEANQTSPTMERDEDDDAMQEVDDDSEGELESVGVALNEQLQERLAARNAGDLSLPLDEAWEQWFKNAVETGEISVVRERQRMLDSARAGHWHDIPIGLQNIIRDALWAEQRGLTRGARSNHGPSPIPGPLTSSQVGILSAPTLAAPTLPSSQTTSHTPWTNLRLPGAFEADRTHRNTNA
ncbi:unnamed protein product [Discula destructiva]